MNQLYSITRAWLLGVLLLGVSLTAAAQGNWNPKADFGGSARYGAVSFSIGTKGYMGTGYNYNNYGTSSDFWEYDPATNVWTQKANLGGASRFGAVGFSIGNKGYVGTGYSYDSYGAQNDFWEYDPAANLWTRKADFGGTARYYATGFNVNGKGYIGTGYSYYGTTSDFWEYDPAADTWTRKADFSGGVRYLAAGFGIGTKGYLGTGYGYSTTYNYGTQSDFWEYDPAADTWTRKADCSGSTRYLAAGLSIGNKGYIGTGYHEDYYYYYNYGALSDFWSYSPASNTWSQEADYPGGNIYYLTGFSIGSKGYFGTGYNYSYGPTRSFYEFSGSAVAAPVAPTAPADADAAPNAVAENATAGTAVGLTALATDADSPVLTYSLTDNAGGRFAIDAATGVVRVANGTLLDFEAATSHNITVQVSDGALTSSTTFIIAVTDVNEAPVVAAQSFSTQEDGAAGTVVGSVLATDPDAGQALTYALTAGNTGGAFAFVGNQLQVANSAALDLAASPTFTLTVSVTDNGAPTLASTATLTVTLTPAPCSAPTAVAIGSIGTASASVSFAGSPTATGGYTVRYAATGQPALTVTSAASPVALTGLQPNTAYDVTVTSTCSRTQTAVSTTASFTTLCEVPVLAAIANQSVNVNAASCGASVAFAAVASGTPAPAVSFTLGGAAIGSPYVFPVGTSTVTATATSCGGTATRTFTVTVIDNINPTIAAPAALTVNTDAGQCAATGVALGTPATADNCTVQRVSNNAPASFGKGNTTVTWTVTDAAGNTATATQVVTVVDNQAPTITAPAALSLANDANSCARTRANVALGTPTAADNCGTVTVTNNAPASFPVGTTTVTWTVTDGSNRTATATQLVTITNAAPVLGDIAGPSSPLSLAVATASLSASFTDNNLSAATWDWNDGSTSAGTLSGATVSGSHTYAQPGVYKVSLTVRDACGLTATKTFDYVVVYDPNGGFVTGGGWIMSPVNTALPYMQVGGRSNFGFVAKYAKGSTTQVDGNTEFQLQAGNLNFKSTSLTAMRLVIAGDRANYKGAGTINGAGNYGFLVAAIDGDYNGGTGPDRFRIKIWDAATSAVVYDNQAGADENDPASTAINGGSIVIQTPKSTGKREADDSATTASSSATASQMTKNGTDEVAKLNTPATFAAYPNPVHEQTTAAFAFDQDENYSVELYDATGRLVQRLQAGHATAGQLLQATWTPGTAPAGVYSLRLVTQHNVQHLRLVRQ